jgi:hypothetical protein
MPTSYGERKYDLFLMGEETPDAAIDWSRDTRLRVALLFFPKRVERLTVPC